MRGHRPLATRLPLALVAMFLFGCGDSPAAPGSNGGDPSDPSGPDEPVNEPPVAEADTITTDAGITVTIEVLSNDSDPDGDDLSVESVEEPGNGTAIVEDDERIVYTPDEGFDGTDAFDYTVTDGEGGTATAEITVTVLPPPTIDCSEIVVLGAGAELQGSLPTVEIAGDVTLSGAASVCGALTVTTGTLALGGHALDVTGAMTVAADGALRMSDDAAILVVSGDLVWNSAVPGAGTLTAGRIEARGNVEIGDARLQPEGTHALVLSGIEPQTLQMPCGYTNCAVLPPSVRWYNNLTFDNPAGVTIVGGAFRTYGTTTLAGGSVTANPRVFLYGDLVDETAGAGWQIDPTIIMDGDATLPPYVPTSLTFGWRGLPDEVTAALSGDLEIGGDLMLTGPAPALDLAGHRLTVHGDLEVGQRTGTSGTVSQGRIYMSADEDVLVVHGDAHFRALGGSPLKAGAYFSAGRFELDGNLNVERNHFTATDTHETVLAGSSAQVVTLACYYTNCGAASGISETRPFRNLTINNPEGVTFVSSGPFITGVTTIAEGASATFDIHTRHRNAIDLRGTLRVNSARSVDLHDHILRLRATSTLDNAGDMTVGSCEKEAGHTITGTDPCP